MIHLEWHQHVFLTFDNKIINVCVFNEDAHNSQLLEDVRVHLSADKVYCCCDVGREIGIDWEWYETEFRPPKPIVEGFKFTWDPEKYIWVEITDKDG